MKVANALRGADSGVDSKSKITELRVDGGMTANQTLMQLQADLLAGGDGAAVTVTKPAFAESTCLGAAIAAGLGCDSLGGDSKKFFPGGLKDVSEILRAQEGRVEWKGNSESMTDEVREKTFARWRDATQRTFGLANL